MPELPEVETLRRDLTPLVVGRTIARAHLTLPKLFLPAVGLDLADLHGHRVESLRRRAKMLLWDLSDGLALAMHLRLAGQLVLHDPQRRDLVRGGHPVPKWGTPLPHRATHLTLTFDDSSILYFTDIRQFGRLWLMPAADLPAFLEDQRFGPEPLEDAFTPALLAERLRRRTIPIKSVLLDQSVVGGIGNIYADESLWDARLHPLRPASSLTEAEAATLHRSIRFVLDYALREGVAFVPQGKAISAVRDFPYCHGRQGCPCSRCGTIVVKEWVGGRGTYWCPTCQVLTPSSSPTSPNAADGTPRSRSRRSKPLTTRP